MTEKDCQEFCEKFFPSHCVTAKAAAQAAGTTVNWGALLQLLTTLIPALLAIFAQPAPSPVTP